MATVHDKYVVELAEVIKGYGNPPDVNDPFCLSEFYRFYEMPNIAVSRDNFEKMRPVEPEQKKGRWNHGICSECGGHAPFWPMASTYHESNFCPDCGADMRTVRWKN